MKEGGRDKGRKTFDAGLSLWYAMVPDFTNNLFLEDKGE